MRRDEGNRKGPLEREDEPEDNQPTTIKDEFSLSWLVVFCLLSPYLTINPGKRYEEVDGVRKEKERLTTDCLSYTIVLPLLSCLRVDDEI